MFNQFLKIKHLDYLTKPIIGILLTILLILYPVYSISILPNKQPIYTSNIYIEKVLRTNNNLQLLISTKVDIDGLIIKINNNQIVSSDIKIDKYSTKSISIISKETPKVIEVNSYNDFNHRRTINKDNIVYTITNNEQPVELQQITTIQQPSTPQQPEQLLEYPEYISYTSISKLDNNKDIIYFTKDHISSNRITTNQQEDIEYQANYQPYGSIFNEQGNEKYKFSGKELDSTNLYYFGARYYNTNIGRFTQVDPIFKPIESPYQYANNNPLIYTDSTGKQFEHFNSAKADAIQVQTEYPVYDEETKSIIEAFYASKEVNKHNEMLTDFEGGSYDNPDVSTNTDASLLDPLNLLPAGKVISLAKIGVSLARFSATSYSTKLVAEGYISPWQLTKIITGAKRFRDAAGLQGEIRGIGSSFTSEKSILTALRFSENTDIDLSIFGSREQFNKIGSWIIGYNFRRGHTGKVGETINTMRKGYIRGSDLMLLTKESGEYSYVKALEPTLNRRITLSLTTPELHGDRASVLLTK